VAQRIAEAVQQASDNPGRLTEADLAAYRPVKRDPLCMPYGEHTVCGHPPPTSGGVTVLQILGLLNGRAEEGPDDVDDLHRFVAATRLAWADRAAYLGDPDAVGVPADALIDADYLAQRRTLLGEERASAVSAGVLSVPAAPSGPLCPEGADTSHMVAIDADGNVVTMTSSIEMAFGSGVMVGGFLLNNQLTDFDFAPLDGVGRPRPNAVAACKRPRSSMAPVLVLDEEGRVELAVGSPGGSRIISYVARVLHQVLDQGLDVQTAIARPNLVARADEVELEVGCGEPAWSRQVVEGLQAKGHPVVRTDLNSGIQGIQRVDGGWLGGVDPRREGQVIAVDTPK
jgi:gamma-glutamyltranspeptidase/glutathione hydrolase